MLIIRNLCVGGCGTQDQPNNCHEYGNQNVLPIHYFSLLSPFLLTFEFVLCQRHDVNVFTSQSCRTAVSSENCWLKLNPSLLKKGAGRQDRNVASRMHFGL